MLKNLTKLQHYAVQIHTTCHVQKHYLALLFGNLKSFIHLYSSSHILLWWHMMLPGLKFHTFVFKYDKEKLAKYILTFPSLQNIEAFKIKFPVTYFKYTVKKLI